MTDSPAPAQPPQDVMTFDQHTQVALTGYIRQHFAQEDDALRQVRATATRENLPQIEIRPEEGRILELLVRLSGARRVLEIGALAGYSGIWLARGLPAGGQLITLEYDEKHARVARENFARAGLAERVTVIQGDAHQTLPTLDGGPFDMVFIDAEKTGYPAYLAWAVDNVRPGGLITAHNAFRGGRLLEENSDDGFVNGTQQFLQAMAGHPRLVASIIPVGDGIAAAVVV